MIRSLAFLLFFLAVIGVSTVSSWAEERKAQPVAPAAAAAAVAPDQPVAVVNGEKITAGRLKNALRAVPEGLYKNPAAVKSGMLRDMVNKELLYQEAVKKSFDKDSGVGEAVEVMRRRFIADLYAQKEVFDKQRVTDEEVKKYYDEHRGEFVKPEPGRDPGETRTVNDASEMIKNRLLQEKRAAAYADFIKGLRSKSEITVDESIVEKIE